MSASLDMYVEVVLFNPILKILELGMNVLRSISVNKEVEKSLTVLMDNIKNLQGSRCAINAHAASPAKCLLSETVWLASSVQRVPVMESFV